MPLPQLWLHGFQIHSAEGLRVLAASGGGGATRKPNARPPLASAACTHARARAERLQTCRRAQVRDCVRARALRTSGIATQRNGSIQEIPPALCATGGLYGGHL
eukprot:2675555-Pyramimonas_sp.AAC.1